MTVICHNCHKLYSFPVDVCNDGFDFEIAVVVGKEALDVAEGIAAVLYAEYSTDKALVLLTDKVVDVECAVGNETAEVGFNGCNTDITQFGNFLDGFAFAEQTERFAFRVSLLALGLFRFFVFRFSSFAWV